MRLERPGFEIRERSDAGTMVRAGDRAEYYPVDFVEPLIGNERAVGFDLASEPSRNEALRRARDTGQFVVTERIELVQEQGEQYGILAFLPVYEKSAPTETITQRRAALTGFALGVYRVGDLVLSGLGGVPPKDFDLFVLDESGPSERCFLHGPIERTGAEPDELDLMNRRLAASPRGAVERKVIIGDRSWRLLIAASHEYVGQHRSSAPMGAFLFGLVITVLLTQRFRMLETERSRVEATVVERTHELTLANRALAHEVEGRETLRAAAERARDEAEKANCVKSEFLANMSHEIRTPMNGVLGLADILGATELSGEQEELASGIRESAESLLAIIDDILDLSKLEAGKLAIDPVPLDIRVVIRQIKTLFAPAMEERSLDFRVTISDRVPERVVGDAVRIRQVLINLLGNAMKFTAEGSVRLCVDADHGPDAVELRFEVSDSGVGMTEESLALIFEPFTQGDSSTTRRFGGTGLGLTICRQLVVAMGGAISVKSELGAGSTFRFNLPLESADSEAAPASSRARVVPASLDGLRVLLAEDNPVNQKVAKGLLKRLGCEVTVVADGLDAIAAAAEGCFGVIILDWQMPVMDGLEAAREIRVREPNGTRVPIVAMTANAMAGDRERCIESGMDDYVRKPVRVEELSATLRRVLDGRGARTTPSA